MSRPSYGTAFPLWREGAGSEWGAYTGHRFVRGLADGSLPRSAFLHYLIQDYVFLVHFSRAWSLAAVKSETMDEMKTCAATVNALVNFEMDLHVKTCAAEGIREDQLFDAREDVETLAYTRYVIDAGVQGDFLDMMAALAPCVMGYGEIGATLAREAGDTPYRDWIETYASDEYQDLCATVGTMIDGALTHRLGEDPSASPRWARLQDRFTTATRLEAGFWSMGMRSA